jgi:hypothetical protein
VSVKHGGKTILENLALSCSRCNRNKGSDLSTILQDKGPPIPLYNPRTDFWTDHFEVKSGEICPKSEVGEATIKILNFNTPERVLGRQLLIQAGLYSIPDT